MKRTKKKLVVLCQNDNIQASKNDSSSEEFEVEKPEPKLLPLRKRQGEIARGEEHLEDEEEKKLDEELSGCGTDFADMTKEEKHELLEVIRASKQEYAQEELLHNLRQSQETNITVTTRLRRFDNKSNTDGNPLLTQNSKIHSPPDGSGDCTKKLSDVASGTKTPKKLRLRRRPQLQITTENERCDSVNNSTRKRTSAVEFSRPAKVSKRSDESGVKLEQNQNILPGTEKLDCVVLLETTDVTPKRDDVIHTSSTATQHADLNLTQDNATIEEDTQSSDDSSVIFEKMETPNPKSNKSQPQEKLSQNVDSDETQDLFSNNDSPSGGATSQTSAKGYHGKSNENEASQGSNSAPKDVATGPQKRKLDLEGDGPSAKRPIFWAWDYWQDNKILGKIAPETPTRKLVNKRALKRKRIESRRYFTPPGVSTGHCTQRIIEFFREEQTNMRRLQDRSVVMVPWGPPVKAGCHMTSTIELRRAEEETSTGTARCLRDHNVKVEGPKSDEEFCTVRQNMSPRILSDTDSDNTDKDVDWLPDLKERSKKPVQAHTRKPANKSAKSTKTKEKVPQDENENIESIPDTPPGGWLKSPAAQKVQSTEKTKKQLDHEETLNSILMQSQAKVEGVVPGKTTRRLGVTRRRGTGNRKTGRDTNRQGRLKCPKEVPRNLFTDDENSSGDDGGVKTKIKCEHGGTNRQEDTGKKVWNVHLEEHSTAASDYLKPTAKVQRKPPARQPGDRVEGEGNLVESKAVAKESEAVAMETKMETKAVVVGTKVRPRGRVVSAVANIAQSVVAGAASLFRGKATRGREEGTDGTKGMLMEISSDEEEDTGEPEQQQQREEGKTADLEQKQASQQQKQAECPMCFKYFSLDGIEEHAFNCQGETASSSPQHEGAPPEGTTVAHVLPVGRLARKPLRQYGRQRIARGQTDEKFDSILCTSSDADDDAVAGRLRQPTGGADTSDKKRSDSPENVEILSDSELPASPTGKRRKRTGGPNEEGETVKRYPCPICSNLFSQALIEAHVLRCLESTETDKRVTRTRRHPDRNGIHTISSLGDDDFDENMPINPKKRQT